MKTIINYLKNGDDLRTLSGSITLVIMVLMFIIAQVIALTNRINSPERTEPKMELRELVKLEFRPKPEREIPKELRFQAKPEMVNIQPKPDLQTSPAPDRPVVTPAAIAQGFDLKKLLTQETNAAKKGGSNRSNPLVAGVSTEVNRSGRTLDNFDLSGVLDHRNATFAAGRRSTPGGAGGPKVGIGGISAVGNGTGAGGTGLALSGRGTNRASRGAGIGNGNGIATISLPSGRGGGKATLDIHALIKWMKAHPGLIPKLVAYDMGHQSDDLASAVNFTMNGRSYTLFLSCNETELLLRICLVDGQVFTLLKDNGIREESNFLIIGDVVRNGANIQSLISSRQAPGDRAAQFYQIFWSWWLQQPESRG